MNWNRVEGLIGSDNLALLAQKRVTIVGLGSGGGLVALSLAMSGVGHFTLVDDDVLEIGNVVRHVADRRYVGQPKVDAVADLIRNRNPEATVDTCQGRIEDHMDTLDNTDILVVAVDGEGPKYTLNQVALDRSLTAVYAGVYERGEGGDVCVIFPYDGPCYACWAAELREDLAFTGGPQDLDYGMIGPEGTIEAEPGLWLHVTRVASAQAHLVLNELLKGTDVYEPMPGNTVILANNAIEIVNGEISPPHSAVWVTIKRNPHCLVCGDQMRASLEDAQTGPMSMDELMQTSGIITQEDEEQEHE